MNLKSILKTLKLNESTISMFLGAAVVLVVGIWAVNFFKSRQTGQVTQQAVQEQTETKTEKQKETIPQNLPAEHTVAKGENLWQIAIKYYNSGYNWVDIAKENKLANANILYVGQKLTIPATEVRLPSTTQIARGTAFGPQITGDKYTVVKGDHLWGIAVRAYGDGFQWVKIARENKITNPNIIHSGNVLTIPR